MVAIDIRALRTRARENETGEAFTVIRRGPLGRVGVGVRSEGSDPLRYFVEVVLNPSPTGSLTQPQLLGRVASLAESLRERGYALRIEDDGCVTGERNLDPRGIDREVAEILACLDEA